MRTYLADFREFPPRRWVSSLRFVNFTNLFLDASSSVLIPAVTQSLFFMENSVFIIIICSLLVIQSSGASTCSDDLDPSRLSPNDTRVTEAKKCLTSIQFNESAYEQCRDNSTTCFIFIGQAPYINIPDEFEKISDTEYSPSQKNQLLSELQRPFICRKPRSIQRNNQSPNGVVFEVFDEIERKGNDSIGNFKCMWGGPVNDCRFNALTDFIDIMADKGYNFAISNFLVELPGRSCVHHMGRPLNTDFISVLTLLNRTVSSPTSSLASAALRFASPLQLRAWYMLISLFFLIFTWAALVVRFISGQGERKWSFKRIVMVLYGDTEVILDSSRSSGEISEESRNSSNVFSVCDNGDYDTIGYKSKDKKRNCRERNDEHYKKKKFSKSIIVSSLHASLVSLVAILVLYYEIGVVDDIYSRGGRDVPDDVRKIPKENLGRYCLNANSAVDSVMRHYCKL